jgi:hypothetical protein
MYSYSTAIAGAVRDRSSEKQITAGNKHFIIVGHMAL